MNLVPIIVLISIICGVSVVRLFPMNICSFIPIKQLITHLQRKFCFVKEGTSQVNSVKLEARGENFRLRRWV